MEPEESGRPSYQEPGQGFPPGFPDDPKARYHHAIAEILVEEVGNLRSEDVEHLEERLKEVTNFLIRAMYNDKAPRLLSGAGCKTCSKCQQDYDD